MAEWATRPYDLFDWELGEGGEEVKAAIAMEAKLAGTQPPAPTAPEAPVSTTTQPPAPTARKRGARNTSNTCTTASNKRARQGT